MCGMVLGGVGWCVEVTKGRGIYDYQKRVGL